MSRMIVGIADGVNDDRSSIVTAACLHRAVAVATGGKCSGLKRVLLNVL